MHKIVNGVEVPLTAEEIAEYEVNNLLAVQKELERASSINREIRNQKLRDTDWTQIGDVGLTAQCKSDFSNYRQALRDVDLTNPVWPEMPNEVWTT